MVKSCDQLHYIYIPNHGVPGQINQAAWYYENWAPNDKLSLLARNLTVQTIETLREERNKKYSEALINLQRSAEALSGFGLLWPHQNTSIRY